MSQFDCSSIVLNMNANESRFVVSNKAIMTNELTDKNIDVLFVYLFTIYEYCTK